MENKKATIKSHSNKPTTPTPETITIVRPYVRGYRGGIYSSYPPYGKAFTYRTSHYVYDRIDRAAGLCDPNLSISAFVSMCAELCADEILRHYDEYMNNISATIKEDNNESNN